MKPYFVEEDETKGFQQKIIRFYFYVQAGNSLGGNFRNLAEVILLAYFTLHLKSYWWIPVMLATGVPILAAVGWYSVNFMSKVMEKISVKNGTHYQISQFNYIKESRDLLMEIRDALKK